MAEPPASIESSEEIGRAVFDGKKVRQAAKGNIPPRVFIERDLTPDLSVDRLSFGALAEIARIQDIERGTACHGWAVVSVSVATESNRKVVPDKLPSNDYHALIVLPEASSDDEFIAAQKEHGIELALKARWVARP